MKSKWLTMAALGVLSTGMIFAQAPDNSGQPTQTQKQATPAQRRAHAANRMAKYLNLTPEQRAQVKQIMAEARQQSAPLREQLKSNREALASAIKSGNDAQIDQITAAEAPVKAKVAAIRAHAFEKIYATLTPEQKTKADAMRHSFMSHRSQNRGQVRS